MGHRINTRNYENGNGILGTSVSSWVKYISHHHQSESLTDIMSNYEWAKCEENAIKALKKLSMDGFFGAIDYKIFKIFKIK